MCLHWSRTQPVDPIHMFQASAPSNVTSADESSTTAATSTTTCASTRARSRSSVTCATRTSPARPACATTWRSDCVNRSDVAVGTGSPYKSCGPICWITLFEPKLVLSLVGRVIVGHSAAPYLTILPTPSPFPPHMSIQYDMTEAWVWTSVIQTYRCTTLVWAPCAVRGRSNEDESWTHKCYALSYSTWSNETWSSVGSHEILNVPKVDENARFFATKWHRVTDSHALILVNRGQITTRNPGDRGIFPSVTLQYIIAYIEWQWHMFSLILWSVINIILFTPIRLINFKFPLHPHAPEIWHHTVWRTWLFIANSDEIWLCCHVDSACPCSQLKVLIHHVSLDYIKFK